MPVPPSNLTSLDAFCLPQSADLSNGRGSDVEDGPVGPDLGSTFRPRGAPLSEGERLCASEHSLGSWAQQNGPGNGQDKKNLGAVSSHHSLAAIHSEDSRNPSVEALVFEWLGSSLIHPEDWLRLASSDRNRLLRQSDKTHALNMLMELGLLTPYQVARINSGNVFGLSLGNYRVLDRLGAGGMAVVYKAEHIEMRHTVAIKVLPMTRDQDPRLETRFSAEMRAVARLRHPNIVAAMDAGRAYSPDPDAPVLWYLVMEYVAGQDLHDLVCDRGPLPLARACNLIHQIAAALAETHKYGLVHRDIKPSNIVVTGEDQAKLLDFGLSCRLDARLTQPGTVLGTVDFMAPEQARDASAVDIRADIYSLGGTMYWCLTGENPFPSRGGMAESLMRRINQAPPSVRVLMPGLPAELDAVIQKMMALRPEDRYPTPDTVMRALLPFLKPASILSYEPVVTGSTPRSPSVGLTGALQRVPTSKTHRIMVVDDEAGIREFCREVLQAEGLLCQEAGDGPTALAALAKTPCDLVLLDMRMPRMSGREVLRRIRENPPTANVKVVLFSGETSPDELSQLLLDGADDFLTKPFSLVQLLGRVQTALRLKDAQDRSDQLNRELLAVNAELESNLGTRDSDLASTKNALVLALARMVEHRESGVSARHLQRMPRYCRCLAQAAAASPSFVGQIDEAFIDLLVCCAPLKDIGKVGLPDHILLKPGRLTVDERVLMQAHTTIGAETLDEVARQSRPHQALAPGAGTHAEAGSGSAVAFLRMAMDIVRYHHERHDGNGYPDRLAGSSIPLAARIVSICDVYDALRCRRSWKPALNHTAALQLMTEASAGQFDPALMQIFRQSAAQEFEKIFEELPG